MNGILLSIQALEPERPRLKPVTCKLGDRRQGILTLLSPSFFVSKIEVIIILFPQSTYVN